MDLTNPLRRIGVYFALLFVFVRFSVIHEVALFYTGRHLHLVVALGVPCILLTAISGGIRRTLHYRTSYYWLAFMGWLVLAVPFSSWRGGSLTSVFTYFHSQFVMLFIIAGLVMSWKECGRMIYAVALGALRNVLTAKLFPGLDSDSRLGLDLGVGGGSISNANDFAAHLLLVLPFVLFVFLTAGRNLLTRISAVYVLSLGLSA